ncbi:MAG: N-alpha-acetyl diaminobutyric acid deacetylase DoeB [Granulosicoccus sp.]|nr:N-alpha-acetyl diaminobutyric acid deacetylase DoeB [Granulosicoccus sp.]
MIQARTTIQATYLDLDLSETPSPPAPALFGTQDTHLTIDPALPGKQHGYLVLPYSGPTGPTHLRVPLCSIRGHRPGPTLLLIGGVHGDEYVGPVALQRLAQSLTMQQVHGCLLIVPAANSTGLMAGMRCMPEEGQDLDLCFPGNPTASLGQRLAHELFERLVRPADLVVDFRCGGRSLEFAPSAAVRFPGQSGPGQAGQAISEAAMVAFGAPNSVRFPASAAASCLQAVVVDAGKSYVQTELGGGGGCSADNLDVARIGCLNVLQQMGILHEEMHLRASRMLEVRDASFYVHATRAGILAPHARPGQDIWQGNVLASVLQVDSTGVEPQDIVIPRNGVLLAMHRGGRISAGDLVAILADEVQR